MYQRIAEPDIFLWSDVTVDDSFKKYNFTRAEALKHIHTLQDGKIYKGIDAFILIWLHLRGFKYLGKFTDLPFIKPLASTSYNLFAEWRFKRLDHCKIVTD